MIFKQLSDLSFQPQVRNLLEKSIANNRLHHAYLFYGALGSGKLATALAFARHILCTSSMASPCLTCDSCVKFNKLAHPDLSIMFPTIIKDGKADAKALLAGIEHFAENPFTSPQIAGNVNYYVESMRDIKANVKFAPTEAKRRIILLHEIEYMNDSTANAFLKLLEEPPAHTMMIMTTSNIDRILPTIKSRCQNFYCAALSEASLHRIASHYRENTKADDLAIKIANGNAKRMFELYDADISALREKMLNFLRFSIVLKPVQITSVVEGLQKKARREIIEFLDLLEFWFRDSQIILDKAQSSTTFINVDLETELNKFTSRYPKLNCLEILNKIEMAKTQIRQNVHIAMTLSQLAIEINSAIKDK